MTDPAVTPGTGESGMDTDKTGQAAGAYTTSCSDAVDGAEGAMQDIHGQQTAVKWGKQPGASSFKGAYQGALQEALEKMETQTGTLESFKEKITRAINSSIANEEEQVAAIDDLATFVNAPQEARVIPSVSSSGAAGRYSAAGPTPAAGFTNRKLEQ